MIIGFSIIPFVIEIRDVGDNFNVLLSQFYDQRNIMSILFILFIYFDYFFSPLISVVILFINGFDDFHRNADRYW